MADSFPERAIYRGVVLDAGAAGVALGALSLAGGSLVLYQSSGLLIATAGLIASLAAALLVGLWVSAPARDMVDPLVRERWLVAALSVAIAGIFASYLQLNERLTAGAVGRVGALLLLAALPAYSIGMALPVLLAAARRRVEAASEEIAPDDLVERAIAGILLGLAVGVVVTGALMLEGIGPGPILLASSIVLLAPLLQFGEESRPAEEKLVYETDTPFHTLRVTEVIYPGDRQPERRLYLNGEEESGELVRSGAPTLAYVAAAESWLAERTPRAASYLFLGGGAYTLPRRVAERDPHARVTTVELDPEVTRAAYRFFGLRPHHGIRSVHADARAYLAASPEPTFDRIYVDVYGGNESLPIGLVTHEALDAMRERLRPGGLVAMNVIGTTHGPESTRFWSVVRTFASVFPAVGLYVHLGRDLPERQNLLLAGAVDEAYAFGTQAGFFELWPRSEWPEIPAALVFRDVMGDESAGAPELRSDLAMAKGER